MQNSPVGPSKAQPRAHMTQTQTPAQMYATTEQKTNASDTDVPSTPIIISCPIYVLVDTNAT